VHRRHIVVVPDAEPGSDGALDLRRRRQSAHRRKDLSWASARGRAAKSACPPGANGTTIVTLCDGHAVCAEAENVPDTADMLVREVFVPDDGFFWGKADASQIEFRLFADFANARRIVEAYRKNPWEDFHVQVANVMDVGRKKGKGLNFGMIYCMGRDKLARQLGVPQDEADALYDKYNEMFPEVRPLIHLAIEKAKERGYVVTRLGRKARFNESNMHRVHSALNRVIQGTAADIMKLKMREVYRNRKFLQIHKMRLTVHDELDCDFEYPEHVHGKFAELLNTPTPEVPMRTTIPILWETKHGPNWAHLSKKHDNKQEMDTRSASRWNSA